MTGRSKLFLAMPLAALLLGGWAAKAQIGSGAAPQKTSVEQPGNFVDVTAASGVHFEGQASHTSKKYLLETMGSGVALFDYDNDGRLDIFLVMARRSPIRLRQARFRKRPAPQYWNRLYHQKNDGTFEDVTEKAGLAGSGLRHGRRCRRL